MSIERLCIHQSVSHVFPPNRLEAALADFGLEMVVSEDRPTDGCDVVVTFAHEDWFLETEWVHSILAGVDRYPIEAYEDAGVVLTNSTGIHGDAVGQTVAGYLLMIARDLHRYRDHQRAGEWHQHSGDEMMRLDGQEICVVGLGTLGRGIAKYAGALGMEVTGVRQSGEPVDEVETVYTPDELHEAIEDARFVALSVPLNEATEKLFSTEEFEHMRTDAYLINVARGPVVDESALIEALETEMIAGAALDVYEQEPLPPSSDLWEMEQVIMTPHVSALFPFYHESVAELVGENLTRIDDGRDLVNQVVG